MSRHIDYILTVDMYNWMNMGNFTGCIIIMYAKLGRVYDRTAIGHSNSPPEFNHILIYVIGKEKSLGGW
jgi:hypothetical protein